MNSISKKILIETLIKNKTILTFWCMNRVLELKDTNNISKDYINHIKKSVNLAIKTLPKTTNKKLGKKSSKKRKKRKKRQSGGIPPVLFYAGVLALGSAYSLLSYDQHITIEKTIRSVKKEFVIAGHKAMQNNHPHLALVYKQISENPFNNQCQIYNPNQLTFTSNNEIGLDTDNTLKLPGTSEQQKENKKKAESKALELYKDIKINNKKGEVDNLDNIIKDNKINNIIDCHVNNVLVAIMAETQEIVNEIKEEIGPKSTYDSIMDLFGLFINPNGLDTHIDGAMKNIENINLKLHNKGADAVKLRNNMKIIFNKITSLIKGGYLRVNNANTAKYIVQTTAIALVSGGSGILTTAMKLAPGATTGVIAVSAGLNLGAEKVAKKNAASKTITFEQLNGGSRKNKKNRRKYRKNKKTRRKYRKNKKSKKTKRK